VCLFLLAAVQNRLRGVIDIREANVRYLTDAQTALFTDGEGKHQFQLSSLLDAFPHCLQIVIAVRSSFCRCSTLTMDAGDNRVRALVPFFGDEPVEQRRQMPDMVAAGQSSLTLRRNESRDYARANRIEIGDFLGIAQRSERSSQG